MKKITVPKIIHFGNSFPNLAHLKPHSIDIAPWGNEGETPRVQFVMAHDNSHIYLKYTVEETQILAKTLENNGRVWEDSCVEMFIAPENDGMYYNFEFNCIGTKLLAVGNSRHNRTFANADILNKIKVESTLERAIFDEKKGNFQWELTIVIPVDIAFFKHQIKTLSLAIWSANFYKCGDGLSQPHFLSWNTINTENPDFHTPQYFGEILFA
jgi:Carbohydrate-binding family 9